MAGIERALLVCAALIAASCEKIASTESPIAAPTREAAPPRSAPAPTPPTAQQQELAAGIDRRLIEIGATLRALDERVRQQSQKTR